MSQYSPSSVGVRVGVERLVAVEQDLALEVQELQRLEADAREVPVGRERLGVLTGSSVQRFDQSERTITTEPFGIRPCRRSNRRTSSTVSE